MPAFDTAVNAVWQARYAPFGALDEIVTDTRHLTTQELRFPGQWFQPETGLYQNWHRDYDPTTGRYLQAGPLGLIDGPSVYGYAVQMPARHSDPRGESLICNPRIPGEWRPPTEGGGGGGGGGAGAGGLTLGQVIQVCAMTLAEAVEKIYSLAKKGVAAIISTECYDDDCGPCEWHHLTPQYLGGKNGPQVWIPQSTHSSLHRAMESFMETAPSRNKCANGRDYSQRHTSNNSGAQIQVDLTKSEIRRSLCDFYRTQGNRFPEISAVFLENHKCS